jgi:putative SOS response-associated peptidase YedK
MSKKAQEAASRFNAQAEIDFEPIYHASGFSFPEWPVITSEKPDDIQMIRWGLIPHWIKDIEQAEKIRGQTLNARSESIFEKPSFKFSIHNKRCFVLSTGFFEWMDYNKKKYPYFVRLKKPELFAMAGIFSNWVDKSTGEVIHTFSIITTAANPLMAKIHNLNQRMPVILPPEKERDWLNTELTKEQIESFFPAIDERMMEAHTISRLITSRKENSNVPELQDEFVYPELSAV